MLYFCIFQAEIPAISVTLQRIVGLDREEIILKGREFLDVSLLAFAPNISAMWGHGISLQVFVDVYVSVHM